MNTTDDVAAALAWTSQVMHGTKVDHYSAPTPCTEWDVNTLTQHLVGGAWMFAGVFRRQPLPTGDPGDLVGEDPGAAYDAAAAELRAALTEDGALDGTVTFPFGEVPAGAGLSVMVMETLAHGWDLATATGQSTELPEELATSALEFARVGVPEDARGAEHAFGPAVGTDAHATATDRLVAYLGRSPG